MVVTRLTGTLAINRSSPAFNVANARSYRLRIDCFSGGSATILTSVVVEIVGELHDDDDEIADRR